MSEWNDKLRSLAMGAKFSQDELRHLATEIRRGIQRIESESTYLNTILQLTDTLALNGIDVPEGTSKVHEFCRHGEKTPMITKMFSRVCKRVYDAFDRCYGLHLQLVSDTITVSHYTHDSAKWPEGVTDHADPAMIEYHRNSYCTHREFTGFSPETWTADNFQEFENRCVAEFVRYEDEQHCQHCSAVKCDEYHWYEFEKLKVSEGVEARLCKSCYFGIARKEIPFTGIIEAQ